MNREPEKEFPTPEPIQESTQESTQESPAEPIQGSPTQESLTEPTTATTRRGRRTKTTREIRRESHREAATKELLLHYGATSAFSLQRRRDTARTRVFAFLTALFAVTSIVLLAMFLYANDQFDLRCREMYQSSLQSTVNLLSGTEPDAQDYEVKYREAVAELNSARRMLFLTSDDENRKKIVNGIYYLSLKMPNQFTHYFEEIRSGLRSVLDGKTDLGYSVLRDVLNQADYLDY